MKRQRPENTVPNLWGQVLGVVSFGAAAFAAWKLVDTFGWVVPQLLHPIHTFDNPPGERNEFWAVPCLFSLIAGALSRRTVLGRLGVVLSCLVLLGVGLMVHWGLQWLSDW